MPKVPRHMAATFGAYDSTEQSAIDDQLALLLSFKKDMLGVLNDAGGYRRFRTTQILDAVDSELARYRYQAVSAATGAVDDSFSLGRELVDVELADAGVETGLGTGLYGVSREVLSAAKELTDHGIGSTWDELGDDLASIVRRAALGGDSPSDAMKSVAEMISAKRTPFTNAASDAERLIRTDLGRIFSLAGQDRMSQSKKAMGGKGLKKYWLSFSDDRTREEHAQAGDDYGPDDAIDVDEAFEVDGEQLMYPGDPNGSADNTINCRCDSVPRVDRSEVEYDDNAEADSAEAEE